MAISGKIRTLDALRRRFSAAADMSPAEIRAARRSHIPPLPVGQGVAERLGQRVFGTPRPSVAIDGLTVGGADGDLRARRYVPAATAAGDPLVVYYHGGGWTIGSPLQYDWLCSSLAEDVGVTVVSIDYRKAPEHPAPAAYDDAVASFRWILEHREKVGATGPVAVAGDSAGGNLSALVAIAARDEQLPLAAQVLIYPGVDLTMSFPSVSRLTDEPILTRADIEAFRDYYLAGGVAPDDPRVSPWFVEDLSGVAPALVQTAAHDPLVDEGEAYAVKLAKADVPVRHTRYVDAPHGFVSIPGLVPAARQAAAEIAAFLTEHLTSG